MKLRHFWNYIISKSFMYLLWPCRVLVLNILLNWWKEVVFFVVQIVLVLTLQATLSKRYIIFWACRAFLNFTFSMPFELLYYNWSYLKAANNVLKSYIKLCYVQVKFKRTSQSCSPSMLNNVLVIEMVNNCFSENKKNFAVG